MSKKIAMNAEMRNVAGKGAARAIRREDRVPAVIYGDKKEPVTIALAEREITTEYHKGHLFTRLTEMSVDGGKHLVLARDVQLDPVKDKIIHVDFLRVTPKTRIAVNVPVNFIDFDKSNAAMEKGIMDVIRYEVEVSCRATDIPEEIKVDLSGVEIGDSVKFSMASAIDGVVPVINDRDFTLANISMPKVFVEEEIEEEGAEGEEGEDAEGESAEGDDAESSEGGDAESKEE